MTILLEMRRRLLTNLVLVGAMLAISVAQAEIWETTNGGRVEGKLSAVYGPIVVLSQKNVSSIVLIEELKDAELRRVADFLATKPAPVNWAASTSKVAKAVKGRLQVLGGEKLVNFDPGTRAEPDFYLIYFGAEWCPPCRAFSPRLVEQYQRLKQLAPDRFEVVFVSNDRSSGEQLSYVKHVGMPWPVLKFSQIGNADVIERWAGNGIPCLVVVTREGDAIFHSYRGSEYLGPDAPLAKFETLLGAMDSELAKSHPAMHRLAVFQHLRANATGSQPVKPYAVTLDYRRYRTLEIKEVVATLDIDETGHVLDAAIEPKLPTVLQYQLVSDAEKWLFLPAVEKGVAVRRKVQLPLKLAAQ
jgi:thiol-disulfide isomerase/thioredoxin